MDEMSFIVEPLIHAVAKMARAVPVDIEAIARRLGVVEIEPRDIEVEGYLARRPDGALAIRYRRDRSKARTRFTVAHEVGHILIAQELGRSITTPVARSEFRDDEEERLANRIAAELLMPEEVIVDGLKSAPVGWTTVNNVANRVQVSCESLLVRLRELKRLSYLELSQRVPNATFHRPELRVLALRWPGLAFNERPSEIFERLGVELIASGGRTQHPLAIWNDNVLLQIHLLGRQRIVGTQRLPHFVTWQIQSHGGDSERSEKSMTSSNSTGRL